MHQIYALKKPIPYSWSWKGGGGHVMVVIGYVKQTNGTFMLENLECLAAAAQRQGRHDRRQPRIHHLRTLGRGARA